MSLEQITSSLALLESTLLSQDLLTSSPPPPSSLFISPSPSTKQTELLYLSLLNTFTSITSSPPSLLTLLTLQSFHDDNATHIASYPVLSSAISSAFSSISSTLTSSLLPKTTSHLILDLDFPYSPSSYSTLLPALAQPSQLLHTLTQAQFISLSSSPSPTPTTLHVVDAIVSPLIRRLNHHFPGTHITPSTADNSDSDSDDPASHPDPHPNQTTDRPDRPEWYFKHLTSQLAAPLAFLDEHIQPLLPPAIDARYYYLARVISFTRRRLLLQLPSILSDTYLLTKTLTAVLSFETYLDDEHLFTQLRADHPFAATKRVIDIFASNPARLTTWIKLEKAAMADQLESVLARTDAYISPSPATHFPPPATETFCHALLALSSRIAPVTLSAARQKILAHAVDPLVLSFYDCLHKRANPDVRDAFRHNSDGAAVAATIASWCVAIDSSDYCSATLSRESLLSKRAETFKELRNDLLDVFVDGLNEIGKELALQYLRRSHMLLSSSSSSAKPKSAAALLSKLNQEETNEERREKEQRKYHEKMRAIQQEQVHPTVSLDLDPVLQFYGAVLRAIRGGLKAELSIQVETKLSEYLLKPFVDRVRDAPEIKGSGRSQFGLDMEELLGLFCRDVRGNQGAAGRLGEFARVCCMDEGERESLREAVEMLLEGGEDDASLREVDAMLEAKGFDPNLLSKHNFLAVLGKMSDANSILIN